MLNVTFMSYFYSKKVMGDPEYLAVFYALALLIIEDWKPEYIFVSTGEKKYHWMYTCRL